jgi:hypothetical protein
VALIRGAAIKLLFSSNSQILELFINIDMRIEPIRIPNSVIPRIPPPVTNATPPSVVSSLQVPVINVPSVVIEYPTIDLPTEAQWRGVMTPPQEPVQQTPQEDPRELPPPPPPPQPTPPVPEPEQIVPAPTIDVVDKPIITVLGVDVELPDPSVVTTAGSVAVVATTASIVITMAFNAAKNALTPALQRMAKKKFKVKIKQIKPILHYVQSQDGGVTILQYSNEGTSFVDEIENVEQYIRDQVEMNPTYEVDYKIMVDKPIMSNFSREGQKRFSSLFVAPSKVAKVLGAKLHLG